MYPPTNFNKLGDQMDSMIKSCNCIQESDKNMSEMIKIRTERDVLKITVDHLQKDIEEKQTLIRRQNEEL